MSHAELDRKLAAMNPGETITVKHWTITKVEKVQETPPRSVHFYYDIKGPGKPAGKNPVMRGHACRWLMARMMGVKSP